ncbi:MAG: hypothetical protein GWM98_17120 [Nitrospinaceae bacterium]|nr:hypothetical protein [Nitrospinaceae bacterium]NIR55898.1 hypothetical protein [Nitrospinaceae bacterium]NIS86344.1 hypothetical protein [Nitrospinaceae bacterium]NIT83180.1 hypothetical protein [Nitrospinaceae bacterium]NIU45389.1 hypothetical protein [Nitrospinaceae bacterium]
MNPDPFAWKTLLAACLLASALLAGCGKDLEKEKFHVFLTNPEGKEEDLGIVTGLSQCRNKVRTRAQYQKYESWDYFCCLITDKSDCAKEYQ